MAEYRLRDPITGTSKAIRSPNPHSMSDAYYLTAAFAYGELDASLLDLSAATDSEIIALSPDIIYDLDDEQIDLIVEKDQLICEMIQEDPRGMIISRIYKSVPFFSLDECFREEDEEMLDNS